MKSLDILLSILDEAHLSTRASMVRDRVTILSRHQNEGYAFVGITLPQFGEWLEQSLQTGRMATSIYARFRKRPKHKSVLPCFLHGLTSRVLDTETGALLAHPDPLAVKFIRLICGNGKKLFQVCDPARDRLAKEAYVSVDDSLRRLPNFLKEKADMVNNVCRRFTPSLDVEFMKAIDDESILPRHGPGATADKAWANQKYRGRTFYKRWDDLLSWEHLFGFSTRHQTNREITMPKDELPVRVVSVPKTMKTSRIICVEPTVMQLAQQLTAARLVKSLRRVGRGKGFPSRKSLYDHLNFHDQTPNQEAARRGSIDRTLATIDLSEASDRVSVKLVSLVFRHSPLLLRHLLGFRSTRAVMPDGRIVHLRKYASMGSALTFPVEAICFLMICIAAVCDERQVFNRLGRPKSLEAFENARKDILVFGDDIIVPADCIVKVTTYLEAFGLKVNSKKTFFEGGFRESCGMDYFNGVLVTPVYLRQHPPKSLRDATSFVSWVSMANRFYKAGYAMTAHRIADYIDKIYKLPSVAETCSGLGWHFDRFGRAPKWRWNRKIQAPEQYVTTMVSTSKKFSDELFEEDRLLYFQLNRGSSETYSGDPTKSPKRGSLKLVRRKVLPW